MKRILMMFVNCCLFSGLLQAGESMSWSDYKKNVLKILPTVQGWCTPEKATRMMNLVHDTKPSVYVEVGVFGGSSFYPTVAALAYNKKGMAYGIDSWYNPDCVVGETGKNKDWWSKVDLRAIMNGFIDHMYAERLNSWYCLIRMSSAQSVQHFKDKSIDILHIDGNHSEDSALFDAVNWLPKVKKGGYIFFDDSDWASTGKGIEYLLQYCELDSRSKRTDPYILMKKVSDVE